MKFTRLSVPVGLVLLMGSLAGGAPVSANGAAVGCGITAGLACDTMTAHSAAFQDTDTQDNANSSWNAAPGTSNYEIKSWSLTPTHGDPNCARAGVTCPASGTTGDYLVYRVSVAGNGVPFGSAATWADSTPKQGVGFKNWEALSFFQSPNHQNTWQETSTGGAANGDFLAGMPVDDGFAWGVYYSWNPVAGNTPHSSWGFTYFTPEFYYLSLPCDMGDSLNAAAEGANTGTLLGYDLATGVTCGSVNYDGHTLTVSLPYVYSWLPGSTVENFTLGKAGDPLNVSGAQLWGLRDAFASVAGCVSGNTCLPTVTGSPAPGLLTVMSQSPNYNDQGFDRAMAYGVYRRVSGGVPNPAVQDCRAYLENNYGASNFGAGPVRAGLPPTDQSGNGCYIKNNFGRHYNFNSALSTNF